MGLSESALRRLVIQRHGTVKAFAEAAGLGRTTVYRLFKGELATVDTAERAAAALRLPLVTLVEMASQARYEK